MNEQYSDLKSSPEFDTINYIIMAKLQIVYVPVYVLQ